MQATTIEWHTSIGNALFPEETTPRSGECDAAHPSTNESGERRLMPTFFIG